MNRDARTIEVWHDENEKEEHRRERKRLSENHYVRSQALTAWLLATLVAVNGGAMAVDFVGKTDAAPFAIGVVLAILSGFSSWQESQDRNGLHYVESLRDNNVTAYGKARQKTWRWRSRVTNVLAKALNIASLSAFVVGCVLVAVC